MMPLAPMFLAGCLAVGSGSDRVLARDLSPSFPALAALPPDTPLGWAPAPGVQRVFRVAELRMMAARLGLAPVPEADICVQRKTATLDPVRILKTMRRQLPEARIEILDFSRQPAPEGELEFPPGALRQTPAGAFWRGAVRYAETRRIAVWAKVRVEVAAPRVIAAVALKAGRAVEAVELRLETRDGFPDPQGYAESVEEVAGRLLRRAVAPGTPLRREWLEPRKEVLRGDVVRVEAHAGAAVVEAEAVAQGSGARGESIWVVNPVSKRRFLARVEGKARVSVQKGAL